MTLIGETTIVAVGNTDMLLVKFLSNGVAVTKKCHMYTGPRN